ncbi:Ribosomal large subunit pseudouridine synthase D [Labilithrix luteola]|uniref:Ribosomal large subunit pseudouridine synthase D n=1 Tax=Labilithrix luteola TaxID=1391654 RepID=A0A0K1PQT4_9BACT|nr:RluA family pseudouridine synthase [Labilithrix luteola]AKU95905.1 Ribosomal large subunit pseudouridine synthase D [Labilithrix luteola]
MKNRVKRWIVRPGDGVRVEDIVRRAGEDVCAIAEGRVFVGKKRVARADEPVKPGDEVRIGEADPGVAGVSILFSRDGLLACVKPAGIPTVPDHAGASHSLVAVVARQAGLRPDALRITSRLDREVSGVVVFATDADAEARLKRAREEGKYARRYVAIASAEKLGERGTWDAPIGLGKDARHRAAFGPDAKPSRTVWAVAGRAGEAFALLAVSPVTGRTHQIRVHAAHAGAPLLGDRDYAGVTRTTLPNGRVVALPRIALHAARVVVPAANGEPLVALAPIPMELDRMWAELGGRREAWDTAIACDLEL